MFVLQKTTLTMGLTGLSKQKSLTLLLLPFITNFFINESSIAIVASFLLFFLLIDVFLFSKLKNNLLLIAVFVFFTVFFYSFILYYDTQYVLHSLRFRHFLLISSVCFLIVFSAVVYYNLYQFINVFLLLFSLSFLLSIVSGQYDRSVLLNNLNFKPLQKDWGEIESSNAPLILVILDELSSGSESFLYSKDSLDLSASENYKSLGFDVIDDFPSLALSTKFSLPSIFNFNLHSSNNELARIDSIENNIRTVASYDFLYRNSLLLDSLESKGVSSVNYGMAPMPKANNPSEIYPWFPRKSTDRILPIIEGPSFLNRLLNYTVFKNIYFKYRFSSIDVMLDHNEEVWKNLSSKVFEKNHFYYFHLIAPHFPYYDRETISEEQQLLKDMGGAYNPKGTTEYIGHRRYILQKLFSVLKGKNLDGLRIIITSDHGFRHDADINPNSTMLFLKGFNKRLKVESVQNIAYLINLSF